MIRLGVNIDHVATIRQARRGQEPDPVAAAVLACLSGADGITIHLREDRRHIQDRDLFALRPVIFQRLNLEMACVDAIVELAVRARPDECTLVPERREELTTEGGLDVVRHRDMVRRSVDRLREANIEVSLFIDPEAEQVEAARQLGATAVELQTASYSEAKTHTAVEAELKKLQKTSRLARGLGLHVHMGHGLNYHNVQAISAIPEVEELNIGHSIVSRAVLVGMERAVRDMKQAMAEGVARRRDS